MMAPRIKTIWTGASPYMTKLKFGKHLRLHIMHRGDADQDLHDHPADFVTFPLTSYVEEYLDDNGERLTRVVKAFRWHVRKAEFAHRIVGRWTGETLDDGRYIARADDGQMASIVWWGKPRRAWGFLSPKGWLRWDLYTSFRERGLAA